MTNVSPYTRVIAECLESLDKEKTNSADTCAPMEHLLINMLQGRMLEHIKQRISVYYKIEPESLSEDFSVSLIEVFSEIFGIFRKRFEDNPGLVYYIARRVVEVESKSGIENEKRVNKFYLAIFCKYFKFKNIDKLIATLQTDPRIQRNIISAIPTPPLLLPKLSPSI